MGRTGVYRVVWGAALVAALAACAPVSPELAAKQCEQRAREAAGPTGEIGIGVSSADGLKTRGNIRITTDFLNGRDPLEVYDTCVRQKTGQGPVRPPDLS